MKSERKRENLVKGILIKKNNNDFLKKLEWSLKSKKNGRRKNNS